MERPRPSTIAWGTVAAGIAAYDFMCPEGETMSERVDSWLENPRTRILAIGAVAITASHLLNLLPERIDPFHRLTELKKFDNI